MNRKLFTLITALIISLAAISMSSCYSPSPLYGTWSDSNGNKINLFNDKTYKAVIISSTGEEYNYDGTYNVYENVLCFNRSDGKVIPTEWDLYGDILTLTWPLSTTETAKLRLYKTGN